MIVLIIFAIVLLISFSMSRDLLEEEEDILWQLPSRATIMKKNQHSSRCDVICNTQTYVYTHTHSLR